jgi:hypothetical protein
MGKSSVRWWVFTIGILAVAMTVAVLGVGIVG